MNGNILAYSQGGRDLLCTRAKPGHSLSYTEPDRTFLCICAVWSVLWVATLYALVCQEVGLWLSHCLGGGALPTYSCPQLTCSMSWAETPQDQVQLLCTVSVTRGLSPVQGRTHTIYNESSLEGTQGPEQNYLMLGGTHLSSSALA